MGAEKNTKRIRPLRIKKKFNFKTTYEIDPSKNNEWISCMNKFIKETKEQTIDKMEFTEKYIKVYKGKMTFEFSFSPWTQYIKYLKIHYSDKMKRKDKINKTIAILNLD